MRQTTLACTLIAVLFFFFQSHAQITTNQYSEKGDSAMYQARYDSKKRSASGMIVAGSLSLAAGAVVLAVTLPNAVNLDVTNTGTQADSNNESVASIIGGVLAVGGIGVLIAGIVTNGKANKIKREHLSVTTVVPPLQKAEATVPQTGVGLHWRLGR